MKRCAYCHDVIIPDIQPQAAVEEFIVHERCKEFMKRQMKRDALLRAVFLKRMSHAVILLAVLAFTSCLFAEEIKPEKEWIAGGVIRGFTLDNQCRVRAFVKIGIADDHPDDGRAQILGFEPGNVQVSKDGKLIPERVYEDLFLTRGTHKMVHGTRCSKQ